MVDPEEQPQTHPWDELLNQGSEKLQRDRRLEKMLHRLNEEQLGKAITLTHLRTNSREESRELMGYILPIDESNTQHLLIFKDGVIMVISRNESVPNQQLYPETFSPSEESFNFNEFGNETKNPIHTLPAIQNRILAYGAVVLLNNNNSHQIAQMEGIFDRTIQTASTLKEQREQARAQSIDELLKKMELFFYPPGTDQPPEVPPPTPPEE